MLASAIASSADASISASQSSMQPMCSVASPRWLWVATGTRCEDALDLLLAEPVLGEALARAGGDQLLRARAGGHARGRHADHAARAVLEGDGAPVQRVDLLRLHARDGRGLVLGVARGDRDLGALGALARAHELGDVLGERLGAERRLAEHDLADRLVDDLLEARHVRALLVAAEIHEAVQPREEQLVADAHDLLHARDAHAREADRDARARAPGRRRRAPMRGDRRWRWAVSPAPRPSLARARGLIRADRRPRNRATADSGITSHSARRGSRGASQGQGVSRRPSTDGNGTASASYGNAQEAERRSGRSERMLRSDGSRSSLGVAVERGKLRSVDRRGHSRGRDGGAAGHDRGGQERGFLTAEAIAAALEEAELSGEQTQDCSLPGGARHRRARRRRGPVRRRAWTARAARTRARRRRAAAGAPVRS